MTARIRRWTRRRKPNDISNRLATVRRHRATNLGSIKNDLLGQGRFREVVALALLLVPIQCSSKIDSLLWFHCDHPREEQREGREGWANALTERINKSLHNISYQTLSIPRKIYLLTAELLDFASNSVTLSAIGEPGLSFR